RMLNASDRDSVLPQTPCTPGPGYSDLLCNFAVSAAIESVSGMPTERFIREELLVPSGADGLISYGGDQPEVNPSVAGLPETAVPLASERLADQICGLSPSTGVFASAKGLLYLLD